MVRAAVQHEACLRSSCHPLKVKRACSRRSIVTASAMESCYMGMDFGTSGARACIIDGMLLFFSVMPHNLQG